MELSDEQKAGPDMCLDVCKVLADSVEAMKLELKAMYVDEELPLAERWYLFTRVPECLQDTYGWIMHFPTLDTVLDSIDYVERHQVIELADIFEWGAIEDLDEASRDKLRMEILKEGYHAFTYDW